MGLCCLDKARKEAGISHGQYLGGHFSPECLTQTIINFLELANGRGSGEHANCNMAPCPVASMALRGIVSGILHHLGLYPNWSFTLEEPKGTALATHKDIRRLEKKLKIKPVAIEVRMCAYRHNWQNPTMIWTNLGKYWNPRSLKRHCKFSARATRGTL